MLGFFSSFYVKHKKTIVIRLLDLFLNWKKVQVVQSGPTLCDHMDYIVHGILQARILKWVAFPFSRGSSWPRDQTQVLRIAGRLFNSKPPGKPNMPSPPSPNIRQVNRLKFLHSHTNMVISMDMLVVHSCMHKHFLNHTDIFLLTHLYLKRLTHSFFHTDTAI